MESASVAVGQNIEYRTEIGGKNATGIFVGALSLVEPENGYYVVPWVGDGVGRDHPLVWDEIFGPLFSCLPGECFEEAMSLSNLTVYGLSVALMFMSNGTRPCIFWIMRTHAWSGSEWKLLVLSTEFHPENSRLRVRRIANRAVLH